MSVFVYMGIVGHDGDIVGHFRPWSMGQTVLEYVACIVWYSMDFYEHKAV